MIIRLLLWSALYVGRLPQLENRKWAKENSQRKKCISTAVKENFYDKTSKRRMFMLGRVFQNKGYFYVPLCAGEM